MTSPPDQFEHYELSKNADGSLMELGRGAMGVTYKAFDTSLRCPVAIKVISSNYLEEPTAEERFLREARGAAQLRHRNVATVFHLGRCGDAHYYAMEFINGETVDAMVRRQGPLEVTFALELASQVASALIAAHKEGLVHRDIKPSNLMVIKEGDGESLVKVIDFGLVKSAVVNANHGALTTTGFVGTPYFASPEQLDQREEDIRSDIYSLGVTLWFMLTGKPTFMGSVASVIMQHLEKPPAFESLAVLPGCVIALLTRMLQKDVDQRFQDPLELRQEIKRCVAVLTGVQQSTGPSTSTGRTTYGADFQTIALSESHGLQARLGVGALLDGRYRLIEDLNPGTPNRTFHAEDTQQKRRVRLKILGDDSGAAAYVSEEIAKLKTRPTPNFVEVLTVVPPKGDSLSYVVLEWIDGFSLLDLLRARQELTLRETLLLLQQIAPEVDLARQLEIAPELALRDILVHFPEGFDEPSSEVILRCPIEEWPSYIVKLNPLGRLAEFELSQTYAGQTMVSGCQSGKEVIQMAKIAYELLGGKPDSSAPLCSLPEQGNDILRRNLNCETAYPTICEFVEALASVKGSENAPAASARSRSVPEASVPSPAISVARQSASAQRPRSNTFAILTSLAAVAMISGAGLIWWGNSAGKITLPTLPSSTPMPIATPLPVANRQPPQVGQVWTNSLGTVYVPIGNIHLAETEARVKEFEAFVKATNYDAVGGMYSLQRDGFKQHNHSWKDPGFPQTPDHPVCGISWEDANQFCAWLTKKERAEGALTALQYYRLPTDREWSQAVGLINEPAATPEDRSEKIRNVYPWGNNLPPTKGNYAGAESKPGLPDNRGVIPDYQDSYPRTAPVTADAPDAQGLHFLAGNLWEWCSDPYNKRTNWRVLRGGSWATARPDELLSSYRRGFDPSFRHDDIGFRCVIATDDGL